MSDKNQKKILAAVTGASGMIFLEAFVRQCRIIDTVTVHAVCSDAGFEVMRTEIGKEPKDLQGVERWFDIRDFGAPPASGSSSYDSMVVLPCSMGTLGAIAGGFFRQSNTPQRRCYFERAEKARAGDKGNATESHSSGKYAESP